MSEPVVIPGTRDVRGSLDAPDESESVTDPAGCVVACPPHPQLGGSRSDRRVTAIADALVDRGVACLRIDYGLWDEGTGERRDAVTALEWAAERYGRVGLFGYSFGGTIALLVGAEQDACRVIAALAPAPDLPDGSDSTASFERSDAPTLVVCGERDETVECERVASAATAAGQSVVRVPSDHHFVGQNDTIADAIAPFLADHLGSSTS